MMNSNGFDFRLRRTNSSMVLWSISYMKRKMNDNAKKTMLSFFTSSCYNEYV